MRKNFCLILALVFILGTILSACVSDPDVSGQVIPTQGVCETIPGGIIEQPDPTISETSAPETLAPESTEPENELRLGRLEGGVYINEYIGCACNLDSDWSFLSAMELEQIPSTVSDMLSGSELGDALADVQQFTDMMAENANDLTTMNVLYQKLSLQERLAYLALTEEQAVDATLAQKDMLIAAYQQAGITVISMEKVTVTFMGEERTAIHTEASIQDVPYFILQFFNFHLGEYAVTTTLGSYMDDNTGALAELFYKLEP